MFSRSAPNHLKHKTDKFLRPNFQLPKDQSSADGWADERWRKIKGVCIFQIDMESSWVLLETKNDHKM